ncbi:hypothetical protein [Actinoallomurus sp. NPDC050550]
MIRVLNRLGDRMLGMVLPSTTARAEACWWDQWGSYCCIYAGKTYCH